MRYLVIVEKGPSSYGAHVPGLPGCVAAGETKEEVLSLIREAIEFHLEDLKQKGKPIPVSYFYERTGGSGSRLTCCCTRRAPAAPAGERDVRLHPE